MAGTTKEDLLTVVNTLIADVQAQSESYANKAAKDSAVVSALQEQAAASADVSAKQAAVQADLLLLQTTAANLADDNPDT